MKRLDVGYVRQDVCRKEMEKQWNEINVNLHNYSIIFYTIILSREEFHGDITNPE
ncbi:unnamed protein product [Meloidogyne enterolobii]|uniref:Uncharacterized protein n=1 Tax=Meloidogyne enterolobii TaxID=390850 RepID=A0ACB0ZLX1_MELEN